MKYLRIFELKRYQKLHTEELKIYEAEISKLEYEYENIRHVRIREKGPFKKLRDVLGQLQGSEHIEGQVEIKYVFEVSLGENCKAFVKAVNNLK